MNHIVHKIMHVFMNARLRCDIIKAQSKSKKIIKLRANMSKINPGSIKAVV